ncbi:MAG: YbfB/YjiJ family MFS transporter [Gammaproteobacteria bacterium]|nr:YbfB/YjiJ family MFS transporter [Gammaproteobacteria bacterium]
MKTIEPKIHVLTAGIISLILTLGIARFAYTPLLPIMQNQTWLNDAAGGWLASINYLGYLTGALISSLVSDLTVKDRLYRAGLIIAVVSTLGMALTDSYVLWLFLRFIAGLSSAAGLLIGSALLLNWLIRHGHRSELGIHFSGLGLGIATVSALVLVMQQHLSWSEQWLILGFIAVVLLIPSWRWLPKPNTSGVDNASLKDNPPTASFLNLMQLAYFCAGIGYVVSATFIVAIIDKQPIIQNQGALTFLFIGLAAAPACIVWDLIARKTGVLKALFLAYILQIVSILLPTISNSIEVSIFGALLFGGTFIGIVSLVLTMAGRFYPSKPALLMGRLTLSYGLAQVIAPAISGQIAQSSGSYNLALYIAAGFMLIGTLIIGLLIRQSQNNGKYL